MESPKAQKLAAADTLEAHPTYLTPLLTIEARQAQTGVVLLLHGRGGTAGHMQAIADLWARRLPHLKFLMPSAPGVDYHGHSSWFSGGLGVDRSWAALLELVEAESVQKGLPLSRVVFFGFSEGAWMASWVALQLSVPCAGLVLFSGGLVPDQIHASAKQTPVLCGTGQGDALWPPSLVQELRHQLRRAGLERVTCITYPSRGHEVGVEDALGFIRCKLPQTLANGRQSCESLAADINRLRSPGRPQLRSLDAHTNKDRAPARVEFVDTDGDRLLFLPARGGGVDEYCNGELEVSQLRELRVDLVSGDCDDGEGSFRVPATGRARTFRDMVALFSASGSRVLGFDL